MQEKVDSAIAKEFLLYLNKEGYKLIGLVVKDKFGLEAVYEPTIETKLNSIEGVKYLQKGGIVNKFFYETDWESGSEAVSRTWFEPVKASFMYSINGEIMASVSFNGTVQQISVRCGIITSTADIIDFIRHNKDRFPIKQEVIDNYYKKLYEHNVSLPIYLLCQAG